jgi:Ribbon-helix-helix protein, copG family
MRVRTQISIDRDLLRRAQAKAARLGISFSEYVRRLIAADLDNRERKTDSGKPDISIMFDLCASDEPTDIARDKDKMIGEAVWQNYLRKVGRKPRI